MLGSLISAGASLLGGLFSSNSASKSAARNLAFQKEAAQNSIQWRVQDAKKAGLSPLYALGTPSFQPTPVDFSNGDLGRGISDAGATLGKAYEDRRLNQLNTQIAEANLAKIRAETDFTQQSARNSRLQFVKQALSGAGSPRVYGNDSRASTPSKTLAMPFGGSISTTPNRVSNDTLQERYGEIADIYGVEQLVEDLTRTLKTKQVYHDVTSKYNAAKNWVKKQWYNRTHKPKNYKFEGD